MEMILLFCVVYLLSRNKVSALIVPAVQLCLEADIMSVRHVLLLAVALLPGAVALLPGDVALLPRAVGCDGVNSVCSNFNTDIKIHNLILMISQLINERVVDAIQLIEFKNPSSLQVVH